MRERYGDRVVEIISRPKPEVAELLKSAKVFVCRGDDKEGSPRPPKEALVAGCVVVVRDAEEEKCDWISLAQSLEVNVTGPGRNGAI